MRHALMEQISIHSWEFANIIAQHNGLTMATHALQMQQEHGTAVKWVAIHFQGKFTQYLTQEAATRAG